MTEYILTEDGYALADWALLKGIDFDVKIKAEGLSAEIVEIVPSDLNDPLLEGVKWWNTTHEMEEIKTIFSTQVELEPLFNHFLRVQQDIL